MLLVAWSAEVLEVVVLMGRLVGRLVGRSGVELWVSAGHRVLMDAGGGQPAVQVVRVWLAALEGRGVKESREQQVLLAGRWRKAVLLAMMGGAVLVRFVVRVLRVVS